MLLKIFTIFLLSSVDGNCGVFVVTSKMLRKYNYIFKWLRFGSANDIKWRYRLRS